MTGQDAVMYGEAVYDTVQMILKEKKIEDRQLRKILSESFGEKKARAFIERMVVLGVVGTEPIGIRLYFRKRWG